MKTMMMMIKLEDSYSRKTLKSQDTSTIIIINDDYGVTETNRYLSFAEATLNDC